MEPHYNQQLGQHNHPRSQLQGDSSMSLNDTAMADMLIYMPTVACGCVEILSLTIESYLSVIQ